MYSVITWKLRPLTPDQEQRMMSVWGKAEADLAENTSVERVCWYMYSDGSGGVTINKVIDVDQALAFEAELLMALGEFIEVQAKPALDLDTAMPSILKALERAGS